MKPARNATKLIAIRRASRVKHSSAHPIKKRELPAPDHPRALRVLIERDDGGLQSIKVFA
jgi:hypothetical protein